MAESKPAVITKSSTLSVGVAIAACVALWYQATEAATIRERLGNLPMIQQDIREMKTMLGLNNGVDQRQDAELRAIRDTQDRHERQIEDLKKK